MLNSPAAIANNPLAPLAAPGPANAGANDGPGFAQALDQASARQRDASGEGADAGSRDKTRPKAETATRQRRDAADARRAQGPQGSHEAHGPRGAATDPADAGAEISEEISAAIDAPISAEIATEDPTRMTGQATPVQAASDDSPRPVRPEDVQPGPAELAAWVSSLALPRPAAAALATPAATRAEPLARAAAAAAATTSEPDNLPGSLPGSTPTTTPPPFAALGAHDHGHHAEVRGTRAVAQARGEAVDKSQDMGAGNALQALAGPLETLTARQAGSDPIHALPALPGAWAAALPRPLDASLPTQADLKAPVGSAEFAPALGSQLSVWVRDGIEHAQLKLNPASMGPIEVRISLDGTQAQVDFSAAHSATRQALQDAVPALAGALRENGLTLTGGGVFEQAREQRGDARPDGSRQPGGDRRTPLDGAATPMPGARLPRARGVVDLYA